MLSFGVQTRSARLPIRGTSGSVQRGPANPARPGREQRYRVSQVCRGDPEVPRFEEQISVISDQISATSDQEAVGQLPFALAFSPHGFTTHNWMRSFPTRSEPSFEPLESGSQDDSLGRIVDVAKAAASCRTPKSFDFFGADAENASHV